jgi:hypothetical protein
LLISSGLRVLSAAFKPRLRVVSLLLAPIVSWLILGKGIAIYQFRYYSKISRLILTETKE